MSHDQGRQDGCSAASMTDVSVGSGALLGGYFFPNGTVIITERNKWEIIRGRLRMEDEFKKLPLWLRRASHALSLFFSGHGRLSPLYMSQSHLAQHTRQFGEPQASRS